MCQILSCILTKSTEHFELNCQSCFAIPPAVSHSHFFILLLSASILVRSGIFVGAVGANTNAFEPWLG